MAATATDQELTTTNPERLRTLREATGLTQEEFAGEMKIARGTIGKLESRPVDRIDLFIMRRLSARFGVDVDNLLQVQK
ncbi:helix-turn-helix domain-containing protein [Deinococcus sp. Leaf326]|uniref:helix-turn-helix domain-containing protein n=1 Tax=Deinococcus sp. Leaf326 TaxID=1736338 RepID=UPI0007002250|nr:helix-turn-helix transcriptional regulator [Deinococcus sp. Leaf326]KQR40795.1 hypothetical protein ASF71_01100 [Deinococcus sp. Leaf326]